MSLLRQEATPGAARAPQPRHRWPKKGERLGNKTERECLRGCGCIRVTIRMGGARFPEIKFFRNDQWFDKTPACEPMEKSA